jgi:hypothetical protein
MAVVPAVVAIFISPLVKLAYNPVTVQSRALNIRQSEGDSMSSIILSPNKLLSMIKVDVLPPNYRTID